MSSRSARAATGRVHSLHRKSARLGGVFAHPLRFLRWTGYLKYRPISHAAFHPIPFVEPPPFRAPDPRTGAAVVSWSRSRAIDATMAHTLVVENGIANCMGHVFDRRGRLIDGATHKHREGRRYQRWIKMGRITRPHPRFPRMEHYDGTVAVLTSSTQRYYFHWLLEILPRLEMLATFPEEIDLLYIEKGHRFQEETLELLSIRPDRILSSTDVALLTAERLVVPCHQIMNGREIPSWVIQHLRSRFLPVCADEPADAPRRIFVSRGSSRHRRLRNEREIAAKLEKYGFVTVQPEARSVREQIRLFRDAEVIVAPHGSGLSNIVFCSPGTKVIELFPAANMDLYYRLSTSLRLSYHYVKDRTGDPARLSLDDYRIAWEDLEQTLDEAGVTPR